MSLRFPMLSRLGHRLKRWRLSERPVVDEEPSGEADYVPWLFRTGTGTSLHLPRVYRRHPWAAAEPVPEVAIVPHRFHAVVRVIREPLRRLHDRLRGVQERWHHRRTGRPSPRSRDEWLGYYQGLYRGHEPDPALFRRLMIRNGVPDWPNPYREGEPGYYDFHPEGLLAADLEAILRGIQQDWGPRRDRSEEVEHHRQAARICWALAVTSPDPLGHLSRRLHVANLNMATMDAASSSRLETVGLAAQDVVDSSVRRGWQPDRLARAWAPLVKGLSD